MNKTETNVEFNYIDFFNDNYEKFLPWLNNVEYTSETGNDEYDAYKRKMQIFKEPIGRGPNGVSDSKERLKRTLLLCALLGKESVISSPGSGQLYCFSGLVEQLGRLPEDNESCCFVAEQWFDLCTIQRPHILIGGIATGTDIPAIGCRCYIKYVRLEE